jgi:hypothetical protein
MEIGSLTGWLSADDTRTALLKHSTGKIRQALNDSHDHAEPNVLFILT